MFFDKPLRHTLFTSVSVGAILMGSGAHANPQGGTVVTGDVNIGGVGTDHVIIDNNSDKAIVDWQDFSIGVGETTTINQVTNDASILNRVIGNNPTEIHGRLESNGQVFVVNRSGILVGATGVVETNGFVASTLDLSNDDFLGAGDMLFSEGIDTGEGIEVYGKIRSVSGGDIFLLSREVTIHEDAEVDANGGYVGIAAGQEILLKPVDSGDGRISIRAGKGKIVNAGTIAGVAAELKAAGGNEYALAINNTGVVRATGVRRSGGRVLLGGGGKVRNSGRIESRKKVVVRSKKKIINSGTVVAKDSASGKGGEVVFESPDIEIETTSLIDVSGALGGGRAFIGGGYQGSQQDRDGNAVDISENAQTVTVASGAKFDASATTSGDAGEIIIWSDGSTQFAGDIQATAADGFGGFAEVSGKETLNIAGFSANLVGSDGTGTILFDPEDITINNTGTTGANTVGASHIAAALAHANIVISTASIDSGGTIVLDTNGLSTSDETVSGGGGGTGNITVNEGVDIAWSSSNSLTLRAENDIIINGGTSGNDTSIIASGSGNISLIADASVDIDGGSVAGSGVVITTNGGDITMTANGTQANSSVKLDAGTADDTGILIDANGGNIDISGEFQVVINGGSNTNTDVELASSGDGSIRIGSAGDINIKGGSHAGGDVSILHSGTGTSTGGVWIGAEGNVTIGSATQNGHVFAGSEHGTTQVFAGLTDNTLGASATAITQSGSVNLLGGAGIGSFAQIGYQIGASRSDANAAHGDIEVMAGDDVVLVGGINSFAFAQIGHGGYNESYTGSSVTEIVSSDITVRSGLVAADSKLSLDGGNTAVSHAQIGHGATKRQTGSTVEQKDISGNIVVSSSLTSDGSANASIGGDILLNTNFGVTSDAQDDGIRAQIGHGATLVYVGSGESGTEIAHGRIDGNITVTAVDDLKLGADNVSAGTNDDTFQITSQIGHGGFSFLAYDGTAVSGDKTLSVTYGAIAKFDDLMANTNGITTHGTDITINAGSVTLVAKEAVQNSAAYSGDVFDNLISNQIGHGSTTVYSSVASAGTGQTTPSALTGIKTISGYHSQNDYDQDGNLSTAEESQTITGSQLSSAINGVAGISGVNNTKEFLALSEEDQTAVFEALTPWEATALGLAIDQQNDLAANQIFNPDSVTYDPDASESLLVGIVFNNTHANKYTPTAIQIDLDGVAGFTSINEDVSVANFDVNFNALTDVDGDFIDSSGTKLNTYQKDALKQYVEANPFTGGTDPTNGALDEDPLDISITEGDIAGNITVYDTDSTDNAGVTLEADISVGLTAITNDRMTNRIGHATRNFITAHDGKNDTVSNTSNDAGDITINQANILGADILVDTVTENSATEEDNQDIELITSITAGLSKAEANDAINTIGHGGEILIQSGNGGKASDGNNASGHGGDVFITRGTIWDGVEYLRADGTATTAEANDIAYTYGGTIDSNGHVDDHGSVKITLKSSDQIIVDDDVAAALSKAEANNAISQIGSGGIFKVATGNGGATPGGGNGGRGGDILINWDNDELRYYNHDGHSSTNENDHARGIMGDIELEANHDGTLTGTDGSSDGDSDYALDITSDDKAALSKADHNTVIGQIGHGDFMELVSGDGGAGGDLTGEVGQTNGGRGGDITVAFNDGDNDHNDLDDLKIESDITVNVQGAIRGEAVVTNALSPEKHGLVETTIGHGTRVYAVAGDGAEGGEADTKELIVGYDPDTSNDGTKESFFRAQVDENGDFVVVGTDGNYIEDPNGEILRGGAVGGDGGDVDIALGDITDRYSITDSDGAGGYTTEYYHDGLYELWAQTDTNNNDDYVVSGDSDSNIEVWATHNESGSEEEQSVYFHAQTKHALSEGPGSEVNAQIGHQKRVQAQGGLGAAGGSNGNEQVNFAVVQADFSGGFGGDVDVINGFIIGDINIEAERQVKMFAEAGHGKETIVTSLIGHNTHMTAITRAGGNGGDLYSGLGNTDNNVQEYWETTGSTVDADATFGTQSADTNDVTVDIDYNSDGNTVGTIDESAVPVDLNGDGVYGDTIDEFNDYNADGVADSVIDETQPYSGSAVAGSYDEDTSGTDDDGDGITGGVYQILDEVADGTDYNGDGVIAGKFKDYDNDGALSATLDEHIADYDQNGSFTLGVSETQAIDLDGDGSTTSILEQSQTLPLADILYKLGVITINPSINEAGADAAAATATVGVVATALENNPDLLTAAEQQALNVYIGNTTPATTSSGAKAAIFELTLQDLNRDDQFSLGDSGTLGTNADIVDDNNTYHDDGIGIAVDGNDSVDTDKEIKTATHQLLNQSAGIDQDLSEGSTALYRSGVNPDAAKANDTLSGRTDSSSSLEAVLMVYDSDGNPQFIAIDVTNTNGNGHSATDLTADGTIYVANTAKNRAAISGNPDISVNAAFAGTSAFVSNVDDGTGSTNAEAQFVYRDTNGDPITTADLNSTSGVWTYNSSYDASDDSSTDKFTYVDLNLDREVDLVDFDADGKFDVVDIDQNGVYDRIDGRVGTTGAQSVATIGRDDKGNANIIDYSVNTGMNFDASHTEGGWQVADLSHADGGRGGNASVAASYTQGDISVQTGNVNFAENEAYNGAAATGATDSLIIEVDVQDNIVATGGEDDTVIARIGHGAYNYADTAGESDDNKVGRTIFFTDTDSHGAAEGGDAGKHALNASGGDGGDAQSILGDVRIITLVRNSGSGWSHGDSELDHLVGDIAVNTRMSKTDNTIVWDGNSWVSNGGYAFVADPKGDGISGSANTLEQKITNESSANRVKVASKVDNAKQGNVGIAQIGHGAISMADATAALGGDGESGNGSEIEAHQTEIANGGHGGSAGSIAHHVKGDIVVMAGRAPDPADEVTSIELTAEEGPRIVPGSNGDIVVAQFGHGRIGYAGGGAGGESDDGQWYANGGDGGDAITIQRDILDTSITVNSSDLGGHGMDVLATALQGSNHIVRSQIGHGDINFAETNAGGAAAPSKSSVTEQWNQQANGGRGGDAIALQAGYNYDITVDVGAAPDTTDADKASLRIVTNAQNIFLGTENHILASIGSGGYSHAESSSASGGNGSYRSALGGISTGNSRTPFSTYVSHREGGRGGNAISEIGIDGTGNNLSGRQHSTDNDVVDDRYLDDHTTGADITVRTHDRSYDSALWQGKETTFSFLTDGGPDSNNNPSAVYGRYDGILVEAKAGPGDNHTRAIDTNTAQIGHSGFNRADALAGEGIKDTMMFGRVSPTNADGGKGIQSIFSANIQEGDGGNGGDAFAYTGSVTGDIVVTNTVSGEANDIGGVLGSLTISDGGVDGKQDADTNIVFRATGGTVSSDHRVDARAGHMVASEAVTDSNGGNAARPPQPVISFIGAVSSRAGAAGDASSIQELLTGDVTVTAENSIVLESKKTTLGGDEGFFVGVGHRLENDLEALGQGGISGMIGAAGTVMQATFKDDGDDDRDDATEVGSNKADEQGNLLATYRALYELKQRMLGQWTAVGGTSADAAVDFPTAYGRLSAYEQSLVRAVMGDPTSTGESNYRLITKIISGDEDESFYNSYTDGNFDVVTNSRDDVDGSRTASIIKSSTTDSSNDHRFGSLDRNEGYGSGKNVSGVAGDNGAVNALAIIFGDRDNDAATTGTETPSTANPGANSDVDEAQWGNIPEPSADEIEALRYMMAASGDGGNVRSVQGTLSGDVLLVANAYDSDGNDGVDHSQANARGIYVISEDAALSGTDLFAVVGHGSEVIKARGGDAGLHHDTAVQTTASIGGDGGDAYVEQGAASGNISLQSGYVIDVEARNNGLGFSEEDTRIGHQLKVGSLLEDFSTGTQAAVVAGIGGQDTGLGGSTRNGSGGDVTIIQRGASGSINLETSADIADGEGLSITDADGSVDEIAIAIFADNPNLSSDHTEVHIGHDQHIDSAQAGDAGRMHALNTFEDNKGLIGVTEGKGGDVTVEQGLLTTDDLATTGTEDLTITAKDIVMAKGFISNGGKTRTLIGHETSAGKEWQDGELDGTAGNKLVAGNGGDSFVELFDDTDGGEADGGTVTVRQGANNSNGTTTATDDYYQALQGDIIITSHYNEVIALSETGNGGDVYTEIGHQLKLSAESGNGGVQRGITQQTPGDGGDIWVVRGRIEGNVSLTADGPDTSSGTTETTTDGTDKETEADGRVLVDAKNGSGGTTETLLGHSSESILTTGRSGFSQEFFVTTYDGTDGAGDDAASSSNTILAAFDELIARSVPDQVSSGDATFTNVDKRDAYRLITNTIAALKSAQQYTDRMTTDEAANLAAAISEAEAALSDLGTAELATTRADVGIQDSVADSYLNARNAVVRARGALSAAFIGTSSNPGVGLSDADTRASTSNIYAFLFGDHADGGDIYVDENTDGTAADSAKIIGNVTLTGNNTEGVVRTKSGYGTGTLSVVELGHRLEVINTTGEGGGETDGGPPEGGEAGDGGNITEHNDVSGDVTLSAHRLVITSDGAVTSLTHFGHDLDTDNLAGMSDIASNGMGNGGTIITSQTASGNVNLNANEMSDDIANTATALLTVGGSDSSVDFGHMADQLSESDDDGRVSGPVNSVEYNRAGEITNTQTVSGNVTVNLDLDGNGSDQDLIIDAGGTATNVIDIMHDATQSAFSGKAGHGDDGDGQLVTVSQTVSGDFTVSALEDLEVRSTGGGINIGHDASNTGQSGQVNPGDGDEYGERVDADQNVSGAINLSANRSVTIDVMTAITEPGHIGHTAIQDAKSADDGGDFDTEEGYRDGSNNLLVADVDADQTVSGGLSITSGEILLKSGGVGGLHYGHEATQNTETDFDTGSQPGHIEANSSITGDMSLIADITADNGVHANIGANNETAIIVTPVGAVTLTGDAGTLQFGHSGNTTTGHNEATAKNGSVDAEQTITSNITVDVDEDLIGTSGATGKVLVGHSIVENNAGMGTKTGKGHENTYLDANGATQVSDASQRVNGNIDVTVDDFLSFDAGMGEIQVGHESASNIAQIGVSDQQLIGNITVNVGTDANGTPNGDASNGDDDALLTAGSATGVHIGHEITEDANNKVQIASGDIWLKVGADLEVTMGQIGHKGYDFAQYTPDADTSYDLATAKAAALAAGTVGTVVDTDVAADSGVGSVRNRIQGNTTIGSAQNSPSEDSTLQSNVMKFANSFVNSGYGGEGDKDVDGELRFFLPAQEGLTITSTVFNDSASAAPADAVPDRASKPDNVFEAEGELDHEHDFELMSETATYSDSVIGPANFGFYFESTATGGDVQEFTPFFIETRLGGGFVVEYTREDGSRGVINMTGLEEGGIGTSSFDIACEEAGYTEQECESIRERYNGFQQGAGSNSNFSGTGGGGQSFDFDEGYERDQELISGFSPIFESNLSGQQVEPVLAEVMLPSETGQKVKGRSKRFAFVLHDRRPSRLETAKVEVQEAVFGFSAELSRNFNNPKDMNTFGEYVEVGNIEAQISQHYPGALSIASSHLLYQSKL